MANIIYLDCDSPRPDSPDDEPWLIIDEHNGKYFGSGGAWNRTGEWVGYGSLQEDDVSLERALEAAQKWADRFDVPTILVFSKMKPEF